MLADYHILIVLFTITFCSAEEYERAFVINFSIGCGSGLDISYRRFMTMKVFLFILLTTVTLLFSCTNNRDKKSVSLKALTDSLTNSIDNLKRQNDSLYKLLEEKLKDEKTAQTAIVWFPKIKYIQFRSTEIYEYIDATIADLESGSTLNNADSIFIKLDFYKDKILRIDPDIYNEIKDSAEIITQYFDSVKQSKDQQSDLLFSGKSKEEQLFILNQTKNNIEIVENKTLRFCNNKL